MGFDPTKPFNELPLLPPNVDVETKPILKQCVASHRALAELKGIGGIIPNQAILINAIPLQEAKASSEIENIVTTTDSLYRALSLTKKDIEPHTKEVLRYREAIWKGVSLLKERPFLTTNLFLDVCRTLRETEIDIRKLPGTQLMNPVSGEVMYTPPDGEQTIRNLLGNLETYMNDDSKVDPLIKLAVMHYQFEAIHPFTDGNGRTGRIMIILYLLRQGLLDIPVLYLSKYIIESKAQYYRGLRKVTTENAWEEWILYMLKGIEETAIQTTSRIREIKNLLDKYIEIAKEKAGNAYSKELIELIFAQPYCRINVLEDEGIAKRLTATKYLSKLEEIGLLESGKTGRERLFINRGLFELLSK